MSRTHLLASLLSLALLKSCATNGKLKISDYEVSYYNFDSSVKQRGSVRISDLACLHVQFCQHRSSGVIDSTRSHTQPQALVWCVCVFLVFLFFGEILFFALLGAIPDLCDDEAAFHLTA